MYTGPTGSDAKVYEAWIDRVDQLTHGTVKIDTLFAGSLLSATDMIDGVANRRDDLGSMSYSYIPAQTTLTFFVSVPYVAGTSQTRVRRCGRLRHQRRLSLPVREQRRRQPAHAGPGVAARDRVQQRDHLVRGSRHEVDQGWGAVCGGLGTDGCAGGRVALG